MIRCLVIDDEPLALKQLAGYVEKVPFFELAGSCQSAAEARKVIDEERVDVLFIDINMPDLNGLDFVKSLRSAPMVVFTTAHSEYAVEGYKVNAVDYLLKPFGMADVMRAANKVKQLYDQSNTANVSAIDSDDAIFLRTEYRVVRLRVSEIICIESMSEYLRIFVEGQKKPLIVLLSMKKIEERLRGSGFMRVHRSNIINLRRIAEITKSRVILDNGTEIPIGDIYRDALNDYISAKFLGK